MRILQFIWLFLALISSPFAVAAQDDGTEPLKRIESALASADTRGLLQYANGSLALRLGREGMDYSVGQARYVLEDFLREHPARRFRFTNISPGLNSASATGTYRDRSGNDIRVYARLRKNGNRWELRELRLSQD